MSSCSCNLRYVVTSLSLYHIKMGSDENRFKVSLIVRDQQSHKDNVPKPQLLKRERAKAESNRVWSAYQLSALPLGQAGSQAHIDWLLGSSFIVRSGKSSSSIFHWETNFSIQLSLCLIY